MTRRPPLARRRPLALVALVALLAVAGFGALAGTERGAPSAAAIVPLPPHPWVRPSQARTTPPPHEDAGICARPDVRCPDLAMRPPYQLIPDFEEGHHVLRAANAVLSIGSGPVEVRARGNGTRSMDAHQYVERAGGKRAPIRVRGGAGHVVYKLIPGQGRIWKFENAARFELWTTGAEPRRVRTGEKLTYCLRDLRRLYDWRRSPKRMVYPACSKNARRKAVTLGTSPGWTDIYPASYYDQWISVDGLKPGCYELVHIADPENHLVESDETNNWAATKIRLPMGRRKVSRC